MSEPFYRLKRGRVLAGVLAGLSDKFQWDLPVVRALFVLACLFAHFPIIIYLVLGIFLPYKEDLEGSQPFNSKRRRKHAQAGDDEQDIWY